MYTCTCTFCLDFCKRNNYRFTIVKRKYKEMLKDDDNWVDVV